MRKRFLLFAVLISFAIISVTANALEQGYCVNVAVTDINPSSVKINEEFTVGISIDNCGVLIPNNISFEFTDISPYIEIKEPLKIQIGELGYSNSKRFLLYHMKTLENAVPGTYNMKYKLSYGPGNLSISKEDSFTITVIGKKAEMSIASVKTKPILPRDGDTVELTLRLENFGDGSANSIKIYLQHPFEGVKESFIGSLDSNEDGPSVFTFIADNSGEYDIPVKISYKDDFGLNEIDTSLKVFILEKQNNTRAIVISIIILVVLIILFLILLRRGSKKEEIIKQLLNENHKFKDGLKSKK